jgi:hypothetical protein
MKRLALGLIALGSLVLTASGALAQQEDIRARARADVDAGVRADAYDRDADYRPGRSPYYWHGGHWWYMHPEGYWMAYADGWRRYAEGWYYGAPPSRYYRHYDRWWYYMPGGRWMVYHDRGWRDYDPSLNIDLGLGARLGVDLGDNRWRYRYHNGRWWYWNDGDYWSVHDGRSWLRYEPGLRLPPVGRTAERLLPDTRRVLPDTRRVLPDTERVLPDAGRVLPDAGRALPDIGGGLLPF